MGDVNHRTQTQQPCHPRYGASVVAVSSSGESQRGVRQQTFRQLVECVPCVPVNSGVFDKSPKCTPRGAQHLERWKLQTGCLVFDDHSSHPHRFCNSREVMEGRVVITRQFLVKFDYLRSRSGNHEAMIDLGVWLQNAVGQING